VLDVDGNPLMPTSPPIARILLREGRAKVRRRTPFTIQLLYGTETTYTQPVTLGVDTGSNTIGSAAVNDSTGEVIYMSEVRLRQDVSKRMDRRKMYRRTRRGRKTRYRKPRFLNRRSSKREGRLSPTLVSKIQGHLREIDFIHSILPVSRIILETAAFDTTALKNPSALKHKWLYQEGMHSGFANMRAYVLYRDGHVCQNCNGKSGEKRLEVHHIVWKSLGGSDEEKNLITLCKGCHYEVHRETLSLKVSGKKKSLLRHATHMSTIRSWLLDIIPDAEETFGYVTKEIREWMELPKTHSYDAVAIASRGNGVFLGTCKVLLKRCIPKGDYQQTKGVRSQMRIPTWKIFGFRKFDKVSYKGRELFIKGRMSTGYFVLEDIFGATQKIKPMAKAGKNVFRLDARKSWIMEELSIGQAPIPNFC